MLDITPQECRQRIEEFLIEHSEGYTEKEKHYIMNNAALITRPGKKNYGSSILRQIYDAIGLIPDNENIYLGFIELIEKHFSLDGDIVEIAGGIIPSLATKIALRQKTGTITVYDPRVIVPTNQPTNLILKRQRFSKDTPISSPDILLGFMPCDAAIPIIESACHNNIDFMIALCEGGIRKGYEWLETDDEWLSYVKHLASRGISKKKMGSLEVESLEKFDYHYPVIYNKRK